MLCHQGKVSSEARGGTLATCCGAKAFALAGCGCVVLGELVVAYYVLMLEAESEAEPASSRSELSHSQSAPATGSENGAYSSVMFCAKNNVSLVRGAAETRAPAAGDDVLQ